MNKKNSSKELGASQSGGHLHSPGSLTDDEDLQAMIAFVGLQRYQKGMQERLKFGQRILRYLSRTACSNGRQPYGRKVEKQLAKLIGCSYTVVTRHRQFAEQFETIQELYQEHGQSVTWGDVRKIIAKPQSKSKLSQALKVNQTIAQTKEFLQSLEMMNASL